MARALKPGFRGPRVAEVQRRLARAGFYAGQVDGHYGVLTQDAVRSFQRAFRLTLDGLAGPQVWSVLNDPLLPLPDGRTPRPAGLPRLVLELAAAPGGEPAGTGGAPGTGGLSGRVVPWLELELPPPAGPPRGAHPPARPPLGVLAMTLVRAASRPRMLPGRRAAARAAQAVAEAVGNHPCPVLLGAPGELPPHPAFDARGAGRRAPRHPGEAALLGVALALARRGVRTWLNLAVAGGGAPGSWYWWGYRMGRLLAPVERLVAWLPPLSPAGDPSDGLARFKAWLRGLRVVRAPWRTLIGIDLAAWLYEGDGSGRILSARRLTHSQAVLWSWRLQARSVARSLAPRVGPPAGKAEGHGPPEQRQLQVVRLDPALLEQLLRLVERSGLGGMVVAGLQGADPAHRRLVEAALIALRPDDPCISMDQPVDRDAGRGGAADGGAH